MDVGQTQGLHTFPLLETWVLAREESVSAGARSWLNGLGNNDNNNSLMGSKEEASHTGIKNSVS